MTIEDFAKIAYDVYHMEELSCDVDWEHLRDNKKQIWIKIVTAVIEAHNAEYC